MIADTLSTTEGVILQPLLDKEKVGVRQALFDYAAKVMTITNTPRVVALYRTVIGEANRFPALAKGFYDGGPGRSIGRFE